MIRLIDLIDESYKASLLEDDDGLGSLPSTGPTCAWCGIPVSSKGRMGKSNLNLCPKCKVKYYLGDSKIPTLPYSKSMDIRNVSSLAGGTGARFLLAIKGEDGAYIAKAWKRAPVALQPNEVLIDFKPTKTEAMSKMLYTPPTDTRKELPPEDDDTETLVSAANRGPLWTEAKKKRNYKKEYEEYQGKPDQIKRRAGRNAARRKLKKLGRVRKGQDVDHKNRNPTDNKASNLQALSPHKNRGKH